MTLNKIIHQVWIGDDLIPDLYYEFCNQLKLMNPEFEYIFWDNDKIHNYFLNDKIYLSLKDEHVVTKVNYIRFKLLYDMGGFYIDVDTEPISPLITLLTNNPNFIAGRNRDGFRNKTDIGVLYGKPNNKICENMIRVSKFQCGGSCVNHFEEFINMYETEIVPANYFYSDSKKDAVYLHSKYYGSWRPWKNKEQLYD